MTICDSLGDFSTSASGLRCLLPVVFWLVCLLAVGSGEELVFFFFSPLGFLPGSEGGVVDVVVAGVVVVAGGGVISWMLTIGRETPGTVTWSSGVPAGMSSVTTVVVPPTKVIWNVR